MAIVMCECGNKFENVVRGQIKLYCSDRCRQRAKRVKGRDAATKAVTCKAILKYPGAKWDLAHWIISFFNDLPAHRHYIEPFAGSAAVFFSKPPEQHEVLNDLNEHIVNFFVLGDYKSEYDQPIAVYPEMPK